MKTAIILAAGSGSKIWPYAEIRPKVMIPISTKPIIAYHVEKLLDMGFTSIWIAGGQMHEQIKNYFRKEVCVRVVDVGDTKGTADTLMRMKEYIVEEHFLVLYGDTMILKENLEVFVDTFQQTELAIMAARMHEQSGSWIGCNIVNGHVHNIVGHSRDNVAYQFGGFIFSRQLFKLLEYNSGRFTETEVGMMSPMEAYLEMTLAEYMKDGGVIPAYMLQDGCFIDIDKPWHILEANRRNNERLCHGLCENVLGEGASIDSTARIDGFVQLGKNSRIGYHVIIKGNIIVGDDTIIENGALLMGNNIVGNNTYIANYCYIANGATIGNDCVINHCAELDGIIFNRVYLYHYMEICGIVGENTDIGAATVCGSLRFDDGETVHTIKGRKEIPANCSCATYIGDYCRTGVNVTLFPGVKTGVYSVIGPSSLIQEDVPNRTLVYPKQELVKKSWGPEKYGW